MLLRGDNIMYKNNDVILIKDTQSEYIDKIIVILNDRKKDMIPQEIIIKQAENIIFEYERTNYKNSVSSPSKNKLVLLLSACFLILVSLILGMHLF